METWPELMARQLRERVALIALGLGRAGSVAGAARLLGTSRNGVQRIMRKHGLTRPGPGRRPPGRRCVEDLGPGFGAAAPEAREWTTDALGDVFGAWLDREGLDGAVPELLMEDDLSATQRRWLVAFERFYRLVDEDEADRVAPVSGVGPVADGRARPVVGRRARVKGIAPSAAR